ncbi:hypothetical protein [Actinoplanes solisilvae]|uniref:hypothetical protein n=1 Tax=Actinoplanes solisilvae TaxID=2486853 RepID=UPI001F0BBE6E|nr:hypothetical protein [Actinoplanes solisilvae]
MDTLDAHARGDVDVARLVAGARQRGRRLRRRRQALVSVGAAAVVAAVFLVLPIGARGTLTLPAADQPGAAQQPAVVGEDPTTVHFTADQLVDDADHATWTTGRGTESVEFQGKARFVLARDVTDVRQALASSGKPQPEAPVRIGARPGVAWADEVPGGGAWLWFVKWQPVDGLWGRLEIYAPSRSQAVAAATRIRFDAARRCTAPFRLDSLPSGARMLECSVTLSSDDSVTDGSLVVGDANNRWLTVRAQRLDRGLGSPAGNLKAGPYQVRRQGSTILEMTVKPHHVELFLDGQGNGYSEQTALTVLAGYRPT